MGEKDGSDLMVGDKLPTEVGSVLGNVDGDSDGDKVGNAVGTCDRNSVGEEDGSLIEVEGAKESTSEGNTLGWTDGIPEG